jgi:hypothetical protein
MAVNPRPAPPDAVAALSIDHFDGLDAFDDLPASGRCVRDIWFWHEQDAGFCVSICCKQPLTFDEVMRECLHERTVRLIRARHARPRERPPYGRIQA